MDTPSKPELRLNNEEWKELLELLLTQGDYTTEIDTEFWCRIYLTLRHYHASHKGTS